MKNMMKGYLFLKSLIFLSSIYAAGMQHDIEDFDTLECILLRLHGGFMVFYLLLVISPSNTCVRFIINTEREKER